MFLSGTARGLALTQDTVSARLIGSTDSVRAGESFLIGVLFKIAPGWHIYWKFAGDAGLPTGITWKLPQGWSAGPLLWPLPRRFTEKGPLTTYGYVDSVLLMTRVTISTGSHDNGVATIGALADWLMCRQTCVPGKAALSIQIPFAAPSKQAYSDDPKPDRRFEKWMAQLSEPAGSSRRIINSSFARVGSNGRTVTVTLGFKGIGIEPSQLVGWFPAPSDEFGIKNIKLRRGTDEPEVTFQLQCFERDFVPGDQVESLLLYRDPKGVRRGLQIVTPITVR